MSFEIKKMWVPGLASDVTEDSSDKSITVSTDQFWDLETIYVNYTTNATAGTRQLVIEIHDPSANVVTTVVPGTTQTASNTYKYLFTEGIADLTSARNSDFFMTPFPKLILRENFVIRAYDDNTVAASGSGENLLIYVNYKKRNAFGQ